MEDWRWWLQRELQDVKSFSQIIATNKSKPNVLQAECASYRPNGSVKALKGDLLFTSNIHLLYYLFHQLQ